MSLDEKIFGFFFHTIKKARGKPSRSELESACLFSSCEKRLQIFSWAIFEAPVIVLPAHAEEGLYGDRLYLPKMFSRFNTPETNYQLYLWRILAAATARRCGYTLSVDQSRDHESHRIASISAIPSLMKEMFAKFPATRELWTKLTADLGNECSDLELWGLLPVSGEADATPEKMDADALAEKNPQNNPLSIDVSVNPKKATLRSEQENPVSHVFEKVLTAEDYQGGNKPQDGDRENELGNAAQDLMLTHVIRTNQTADSFVKVDHGMDGVGFEVEAQDETPGTKSIFYYPEWHQKNRVYKNNWCKIVEEPFAISAPMDVGTEDSAERVTARQLRLRLERLVNKNDWVRRQLDGEELDLNAVVERQSDLLAGGAVSDRVHMAKRPLRWDIATLILLDTSQSTDGWIGGHRVFDVLKSVVRILSEAFTGLGEQTSLCAFNSYTRGQCRYLVLKDFAAPWPQAITTLNAMEPQGYSRIGPAIRHALHKLAAVKARKRQLLILSDMKPTDYDFYEGQHGAHDVRKALSEARQQGIHYHALTISTRRSSLHEKMLGSGHFSYVTEPQQIADKIFQIYLRSSKSGRRS